ncbi:hypothetical protein Dsin_001152 [Dipteronia sinensis]|uniref:Protein FAR1-RELATED SEQUENCE n=1 Tax=Dipteronia sinensis TaxID=43782 RepID=A0AAE0B3B3_9ROSI|nr:hypothetical protein Dsin_001152 [Dipteronia sinensis]
MDCATKERHVKMDRDNTLSCSCRMFEMKGVLCSHVIKILRDALNIKEIPTQYILKRWTKQARVECVQDMHGREIQEDPKLQQTYRYRSLCSIFTRISSRASESEKAYILANEQASNLTKLVEDILHIEMVGNNHEKDHGSQTVAVEMDCAQDSNIVKAKGLKKKETSRGRRRIKSSLEKTLEKRKKYTKAHIQSHTTDSEIHYPPMVYSPYTAEPQLQGCNIASTLMPWINFEQSQPRSFQELLQQNSVGSFEFRGSQASK